MIKHTFNNVKKMGTYIAHPVDEAQAKTVKAFLEALRVPYETEISLIITSNTCSPANTKSYSFQFRQKAKHKLKAQKRKVQKRKTKSTKNNSFRICAILAKIGTKKPLFQ